MFILNENMYGLNNLKALYHMLIYSIKYIYWQYDVA